MTNNRLRESQIGVELGLGLENDNPGAQVKQLRELVKKLEEENELLRVQSGHVTQQDDRQAGAATAEIQVLRQNTYNIAAASLRQPYTQTYTDSQHQQSVCTCNHLDIPNKHSSKPSTLDVVGLVDVNKLALEDEESW